MDCTRNKIKEIVSYMKTLGLEVKLNTYARGHQGFFFRNRIDVSKNTPKEKIVSTLLHEFAHYIHYKIDPNFNKKDNSIGILFATNKNLEDELISVTNFVDNNSKFQLLNEHKEKLKNKISKLENDIKIQYPNFKRSKKFKEFERYIKYSKARFLLKYDRVKYITPFLRRVEYYSIDNLEQDFKMPQAFYSYIYLRSYQRKQKRISAKINKLRKYYYTPTELFARFIEGIYLDEEYVKTIAPNSYSLFKDLLNRGYYLELSKILSMASEQKQHTYQ